MVLWKYCPGLFGTSFLLRLELGRGEARISGCHFRVEVTFLDELSGCEAWGTLASPAYGCSF